MESTAVTLSAYMAMADAESAPRRESRFFGLNDPSVAGLRAFVRYYKDARGEIELGGKLRSLTHKQMAMAGAVARISVTHEHATITSIAKEANCVPSTASRFLLKLQAWNAYAIDVTRGRHGGVRIRLRGLKDGLHGYAERAWLRIKQAAERALSRTKRNVASTIPGSGSDLASAPIKYVLPMDATFSEAERVGAWRPCYLLDCPGHYLETLPQSRTAREADARAADLTWVNATIHEIRKLNAGEPDWDVYLENVRSSYGLG